MLVYHKTHASLLAPPWVFTLIRKPSGSSALAAAWCYHQQGSYKKLPAIKANL
jgi:hypothetical protein